MNKAYLYLSRGIIQLAIRQLIAQYPKLFFLSGWVGTLIAIIFSPLLGHIISSGILKADFAMIEKSVAVETNEWFEFYRELDAINKSKEKVTEEKKKEMIRRAKEVTVRFLSVKQYLK